MKKIIIMKKKKLVHKPDLGYCPFELKGMGHDTVIVS